MVNQVTLVGRLGKDPEVKNLESGSVICNYSLATSKKYKNKNDEVIESTEWHRIVCFDKLAELASKYLKKGSLVFVQGEIRYRSYDNKDGVKTYLTEIFVSSIRFLDMKKEEQSAPNTVKEEQQNNLPYDPGKGEDDLQF